MRRMYTEVQAEDVAISLFIKRLADEDAGQYRCTAVYAGNRELEAAVSVSIFRECCQPVTSYLYILVLQTKAIRMFVITEKAPTRAFSWLKAATTAFTFKTLC